MTTLKERQQRLENAMRLVKLDDAGAILNPSEVETRMREEFGMSRDGAQMLVVQAAHRLRFKLAEPSAVAREASAMLSIPEAVRLAEELDAAGEIEKAPGRQAIARAVLLGRIPTAAQDSGRRWHFQRRAFVAWLNDDAQHKPGRKTPPEEARA